MKKRILIFILIISLFCTTTAFATDSKSNTLFPDVPENAWYTSYLETATKYGIVNGYADGTFKPNNNMSHIEALKLSVVSTMTLNNTDNSSWDARYINTANYYQVLNNDFYNQKSAPITRYEFFRYIYCLLNGKYDFNTIETRAIFADYNDEVTTFLYDNNIVSGCYIDGLLCCNPNSYIVRAEAITLVSRVIECVFSKDSEVPLVELVDEPITNEEIINVFLYMAFNQLDTFEVKYQKNYDYATIGQRYVDLYNFARELYYNYFQIYGSCSLKIFTNGIDYTFRISLDKMENSDGEITRFFENAKNINTDIWNKGIIDFSMTQYEMAEKLYEYVCKNYEYFVHEGFDLIYNQGNLMLDNNKGICAGYVAIYNTLCQLNGIKALGLSDFINNESHIYSVLWLDGVKYYADPTFGDPVPNRENYADMSWFGLTEQQMIEKGRKIFDMEENYIEEYNDSELPSELGTIY